MSHTPGPWRWGFWVHRSDLKKGESWPFYEFKKEGSQEDGEVLSAAEYGTVAEWRDHRPPVILHSCSTGYGGESTVDVGPDDAALIAAAPDMLAALKAISSDWFYPGNWDKVKAAIKKAGA